MTPLREDDFVAAIAAIAGSDSRLVLGIGDDAAAWQPSRSHRSVITTDASIDGIHFSDATMSRYDAGWRSMTANLSDIAAMGARPVLATIALALAEADTGERALELYRGVAECARAGGCAIAGGDVTRSAVTMLSITVVGEVRATALKMRAGARSGDVIVATGTLGASRAGLEAALGRVSLEPAAQEEALSAHRRPLARLQEGRFLAASANVHAMMDCSDGLSTDLARMAKASGLGAVVERVPAAASAQQAARALGLDPDAIALSGGEEYELLAAISPRAVAHLGVRFERRFGRRLEVIGRFREGSGCYVRNDIGEDVLPPSGWDHFA